MQTKRTCIASNFVVLVLSEAVLSPPRRTVLVLEALWYSKPAHWSAGYRVTPRSTIDIAAVQTAIEHEHEIKRSCIASDFIVLVLSQAVLSPPRRTVLVLEALWYSKPAHWSAGYK